MNIFSSLGSFTRFMIIIEIWHSLSLLHILHIFKPNHTEKIIAQIGKWGIFDPRAVFRAVLQYVYCMGNIRKSESQGDSSPDLGPTLLADQGVKAGAVTSARLQFRLQFRLPKTYIYNLFKTVHKMSEITFNTCIGRYAIQCRNYLFTGNKLSAPEPHQKRTAPKPSCSLPKNEEWPYYRHTLWSRRLSRGNMNGSWEVSLKTTLARPLASLFPNGPGNMVRLGLLFKEISRLPAV